MKQIIIGIGNILFKDEGVGILASKYLEANYIFTPEIEIIDGGTLGFKLMEYFLDYDNVIILDTVSVEDAPGSVYRLPSEVLLGLGNYRKTAHEVEIVEMLESCAIMGEHADVTIIGIVPEDISTVETGLTSTLEKSFEGYISHVIKELENLGISAVKSSDIPLKEVSKSIIGSYNGEHNDRIGQEG